MCVLQVMRLDVQHEIHAIVIIHAWLYVMQLLIPHGDMHRDCYVAEMAADLMGAGLLDKYNNRSNNNNSNNNLLTALMELEDRIIMEVLLPQLPNQVHGIAKATRSF